MHSIDAPAAGAHVELSPERRGSTCATIGACAPTSIRYFADGRGREPVREYVETLRSSGDVGAVASFRHLLELIEAEGAPLGMPQDRIIDRGERVWELRFGSHRCA